MPNYMNDMSAMYSDDRGPSIRHLKQQLQKPISGPNAADFSAYGGAGSTDPRLQASLDEMNEYALQEMRNRQPEQYKNPMMSGKYPAPPLL